VVERKDFIARVIAESHFKKSLKEAEAEYVPINFYGKFLKRQIEELETQRKESIE